MVCIGCVRRENFQRDFVAQNFALIAPVLPILLRVYCSNKTIPNDPNITKCNKTWVLGPMICIGCVRSEKFQRDFVAQNFALIAPVRPILLQFVAVTKWSQMTQTLRNATKHGFWVPWFVSGAFVAKSSHATSWHKLLHKLHQFGPFCTEFSAVTKQSQTHINIMKCNKTWVLCPMMCVGCFRRKKFRRKFVARTFALISPVRRILHQV